MLAGPGLPGSNGKSFREFCDQARGVVSDAPPDWQEVRIRAGFAKGRAGAIPALTCERLSIQRAWQRDLLFTGWTVEKRKHPPSLEVE